MAKQYCDDIEFCALDATRADEDFLIAAMKEAESSLLSGETKKQFVIDTVKTSCKAANIDLDLFIDKLSEYIDQTIDFVNKMNLKK